MPPLDEREEIAWLWLPKARSDLEFSSYGLQSPENYWGVCYHAQQAVEKALKGYLAWLGEEELPRTHDLAKLAALAVARGGSAPEAAVLADLQDYAVEPRYPESADPTASEAHAAYQKAGGVVRFVHEQIGWEPPSSE